jgi:3-hydroxyisobutyrate dehydrogenase-like beta-hydroxyacid dehydrogenase
MANLGSGVAIIGFGEAAEAFVSGWRERNDGAISCYDLKIGKPGEREDLQLRGDRLGVRICGSQAEALAGARAVFSLVTADQALVAAQDCAAHIPAGTVWFDCNSCSPGTKRQAAEVIEAAGGIYVDGAVMAPVHPKRHRTPLLVSGPGAVDAMLLLEALDMQPRHAGGTVGQASSIKMFRSVMIKGFEALTAECLLAARRAGVEAEVLHSLQASDPGIDWAKRSAYNLERMMVHGERRAAEMREVARTVTEQGLPSRMSDAITDWQAEIAGLGLAGGSADVGERADRILKAILPAKPVP